MKIKWRGKLSETNTFPTTEIPANAVQFLEPKSQLKTQVPIIPIFMFILVCLATREKLIAQFNFNLIGLVTGGLLAIPFMLIHELLHAVCFPSKSTAEIFYSGAGFSIVTNSPIYKSRYIVTLLFPALILGIIPLLIWVFIPVKHALLSSIWFMVCVGNLSGTAADFYNLVRAIKEMPNGSVLQISGLKCYYY